MKMFRSSSLLALLIIFLPGCYVEKMLPDKNLIIEKDDKIISYTDKDGKKGMIAPEGFFFEKANLSNDSLVLYAYKPTQKGRISSSQKIPVSEIHSITLLPGDKRLRYGFTGLGFGSGTFASGGFTFINNMVGGSFSLKGMWLPANLPSDYNGFFHNDNIFMLDIMGVYRGEVNEDANLWWGVELGPSFVEYRKEVEIPNLSYGTNLDFNKYHRDNIIRNATGLSSRLKITWTFSKHWGLEFALFGNINKIKSIGGFECSILFGKLK